jgi:hypothetical protein
VITAARRPRTILASHEYPEPTKKLNI